MGIIQLAVPMLEKYLLDNLQEIKHGTFIKESGLMGRFLPRKYFP